MQVAICCIQLYLPAAGSLKGKRQIVKSVIERVRARTKASVAETGCQDVWQRAEIGAALVSSDRGLLEKQVQQIRRIVDDCWEAETVEFQVEYL